MVFPEDYNLANLVGKNIVERRKRIGMTQDSLAEALHISGAALSRIERGLSAPKFGRMQELANLLQCEVADLFRNDQKSLSVRIDTIEDMLKGLPDSTQEDLVHLLVVAIQILKKNMNQGK